MPGRCTHCKIRLDPKSMDRSQWVSTRWVGLCMNCGTEKTQRGPLGNDEKRIADLIDGVRAAIPLIALANEAGMYANCAAPMIGSRTLKMLEKLAGSDKKG